MSKFLTLNWSDFLKGLLMFVIGTIISTGYDLFIAKNALPDTFSEWWTAILLPGVLAGVSYIVKNLFTNSDNKFATVERV